MNKNYSYSSVLIVGMGLIGSSIARSLKENKIAEKVYALDNNEDIINTTNELKIVDDIKNNLNKFTIQFDIIFICTPLSAYKSIFDQLNNYVRKLTPGEFIRKLNKRDKTSS